METKTCRKSKNDKWIEENKEHIKEYKKIYYRNNSTEIKERSIKNRINNIEKRLISEKKYREKNHEKILERKKKYRESNTEKIIERRRNHYEKNKIKINKQLKDRRNVDCFLNSKNLIKKGKTFDIVGCTPIELKEHIENQFTEGMTWNNYGFYGWHIDHKIPLDSGKTEEEIYGLCRYTNLQPMWWLDNFKKGKKF